MISWRHETTQSAVAPKPIVCGKGLVGPAPQHLVGRRHTRVVMSESTTRRTQAVNHNLKV